MPDYGARVADKAIRETERKLRSTYSTAQRELREKLKTFNEKYKVKDAIKRKQLSEGKISKQDYADWKAGQVFQRKQWEAKVKEVVSVMTNSNEQAAKIINEGRLDVFSENYNFLAFLGEKQIGISFDVYNTQSVARLIHDDPKILPEWKIDEEKDYEWNYKKVNNIVQQGIIQGEGIPEMTKRLCTDLATQNQNKMRMFARTAITGAQNAGRQKQMEDAAEMGIQVEKQWIATLDSRTRDWHRDRDGETVPYNKEFSGGLKYPGDSAGDPADVYNCRCTMITVYPEHAAHHEGGARRAYSEYEDEDGEHRKGYVTVNPNVYEGWSEKAYRRWLETKKIAEPKKEKQYKPEKAPMSAEEYEEWLKENSTEKELRELFEEKYKDEIVAAKAEKYGDVYVESEGKWLSDIKDEWFDPLYQVSNGYGRCGYVQAADGSKAINAYLRRKEVGIYSVKEINTTIEAMDKLIGISKLDRMMVVDRCAGIDALERLGINCGNHGRTYRIGHAFCTDGIDMKLVVDRINNEFAGSTIVDNGYMSASVVPKRNVFGGSDVTFTLVADKGTHAFITKNTRESEIVFAHGTEQEILGARVVEREVTDYDGKKTKRETIEVFIRIKQE